MVIFKDLLADDEITAAERVEPAGCAMTTKLELLLKDLTGPWKAAKIR